MPGWRGNEAKLLHDANCVGLGPVFDHFAIHYPVDFNKGPLHALTSRWCAHEHPLMSALARHPVNDFVALGDEVVNGRAQIGESCEQHGEKHAGAFDSRRHSWTNSMVYKARPEMGEGAVQVSGVGQFSVIANNGLVLLEGHGNSLPLNWYVFWPEYSELSWV